MAASKAVDTMLNDVEQLTRAALKTVKQPINHGSSGDVVARSPRRVLADGGQQWQQSGPVAAGSYPGGHHADAPHSPVKASAVMSPRRVAAANVRPGAPEDVVQALWGSSAQVSDGSGGNQLRKREGRGVGQQQVLRNTVHIVVP